MRILTIKYASERKYEPVNLYYPEDMKTPKQRLEYLKDILPKYTENLSVVSACPYCIEAIYKLFKYDELKCYIDDNEVDLNSIFTELALPMKEIQNLIH